MSKQKGNSTNFKNVCHQFFRKEDIFLVPNILCYIRVLLIAGFMACYLIPFSINGNSLAHIYIATGIMMLAAYSDFIDGFIARTFDQKSELGKFLDPVADKLLQLAIIVVILIHKHSYVFVNVMFGVFIAKEITLFFEDLFLARHNTAMNGAKWYGKLSSFVFYVMTAFILIGIPIINAYVELPTTEHMVNVMIDVSCIVVTLCLILAWVLYFRLFVILMKKAQQKGNASPREEKHD